MAYSIEAHFHPSSSSSSSSPPPPPPPSSSAFQNMPLYDPTVFLPMLVSGHASFRSLLDILSAIQQKAHEFEGMLHLGQSGLAYHEVASGIATLISQLVVEATGTLERFSISLPQVITGDLHLHNLSASELEPIEAMPQCFGGYGPNLAAAPNNSLHSLIDNNNYNGSSDGLLPNKAQSNKVGQNIATIAGMGPEDVGSEREEEEEEEVENASGGKGGNEEARVGESYELVEMEAVEILAEHTHFCEICGKGFKRDANLRMHRRGHGDEYKTPAALARSVDLSPSLLPVRRYSCPLVGCKRNKQHRRFRPLKTLLCVKNHYRRSHCPKIHTCTKCCTKSFSVVADLKTHEKHCGWRKWECSCGTTFSRKDKLFGHVNLFLGHTPMQPSLSTIATTTTITTITTANKNPNITGSYCPMTASVEPARFVSNPILAVDNNNNNNTAHIAKAGGLQGLSDENLMSCSSDLQDLLTSNFLHHSSAPRPY